LTKKPGNKLLETKKKQDGQKANALANLFAVAKGETKDTNNIKKKKKGKRKKPIRLVKASSTRLTSSKGPSKSIGTGLSDKPKQKQKVPPQLKETYQTKFINFKNLDETTEAGANTAKSQNNEARAKIVKPFKEQYISTENTGKATSSNQRKFGFKVKNDLTKQRVFITPTESPDTHGKLDGGDAIFDSYPPDENQTRNLRGDSQQSGNDALANLFSLANRSKGKEKEPLQKILNTKRTNKINQKQKDDPLADLFSFIEANASPKKSTSVSKVRLGLASAGEQRNSNPTQIPARTSTASSSSQGNPTSQGIPRPSSPSGAPRVRVAPRGQPSSLPAGRPGSSSSTTPSPRSVAPGRRPTSRTQGRPGPSLGPTAGPSRAPAVRVAPRGRPTPQPQGRTVTIGTQRAATTRGSPSARVATPIKTTKSTRQFRPTSSAIKSKGSPKQQQSALAALFSQISSDDNLVGKNAATTRNSPSGRKQPVVKPAQQFGPSPSFIKASDIDSPKGSKVRKKKRKKAQSSVRTSPRGRFASPIRTTNPPKQISSAQNSPQVQTSRGRLAVISTPHNPPYQFISTNKPLNKEFTTKHIVQEPRKTLSPTSNPVRIAVSQRGQLPPRRTTSSSDRQISGTLGFSRPGRGRGPVKGGLASLATTPLPSLLGSVRGPPRQPSPSPALVAPSDPPLKIVGVGVSPLLEGNQPAAPVDQLSPGLSLRHQQSRVVGKTGNTVLDQLLTIAGPPDKSPVRSSNFDQASRQSSKAFSQPTFGNQVSTKNGEKTKVRGLNVINSSRGRGRERDQGQAQSIDKSVSKQSIKTTQATTPFNPFIEQRRASFQGLPGRDSSTGRGSSSSLGESAGASSGRQRNAAAKPPGNIPRNPDIKGLQRQETAGQQEGQDSLQEGFRSSLRGTAKSLTNSFPNQNSIDVESSLEHRNQRTQLPSRPRGPHIKRNKAKSYPEKVKDTHKSKSAHRSKAGFGCKHLCGTIIYDVYQLLGGQVCDC